MAIIGLLRDHAPDRVPASHLDLVECPPAAALTTLGADGRPQTSVVWCDVDGDRVRVNTMRGFAKERNMRRDPRVALLCYDPRRPLRYLEVRGTVVEMTEAGALEHLDALASKYASRPIRYFGDAIPAHFAETEVPVLCLIRPTRVVALDGEGARSGDAGDHRHGAGAEGDGAKGEVDGAKGEVDGAKGEVDRPPVAHVDLADAPAQAPSAAIPSSHVDLLERPVCGVLTTLGPGGAPESSLVWVDFDGECARVNTTLERRKGRNLVRDPRLSLLVVDPDNTGRFLQVRGDAELVTDGALPHVDALTRKYTRHPRYYGCIYPADRQARDTRVICRIRARRVTCDAIHA